MMIPLTQTHTSQHRYTQCTASHAQCTAKHSSITGWQQQPSAGQLPAHYHDAVDRTTGAHYIQAASTDTTHGTPVVWCSSKDYQRGNLAPGPPICVLLLYDRRCVRGECGTQVTITLQPQPKQTRHAPPGLREHNLQHCCPHAASAATALQPMHVLRLLLL